MTDIIFDDNYITTDAKTITDSTTGQIFKVASCQHIVDEIVPAQYSNDASHTELFPAREVIRSRVTIEASGLNSGCENVNSQHLFTYDV